MKPDPDPVSELDVLAEEFVSRARRGERPSISEYARRHKQHADEIREIFPLLTVIEEAKAAKPMPGTRIGPYEILREVGRGGMGIVYEALQVELGRRVALKILPPQATLDSHFLERFRLEAKSAARLKHSSIVPVIGYGSDDDVHFYSMQFIDGRSLDQVIGHLRARDASGERTRGRDDYRRVARIGLQIAEAMAHAHAHGVLHRDLKPTNVLLDVDDHAWITDFGLCQLTGSDGLTRTGDVVGTFRYMPPERFSGVSDVRGDIYGIGITLYELLTRTRAYEGEDAAQLAARIPREQPARPRSLDSRIPAELDLIVRKAMAHEPGQRYPTAEALAADLRAYLADEPISARAPTFTYLMRKALARHRALALTSLLALVLLVGSAIWYVSDLRSKERSARKKQYVASIAAVASSLTTPERHRGHDLLAAAPKEFRNWEWHYLKARVGGELRRFETVPHKMNSVAFSPDGRMFASAGGGKLQIHDYESGTRLAVHELGPGLAQSVAWHPDGDQLVVSTTNGLQVWNVDEGQRTLFVTRSGSDGAAFIRDGAEIVAAVGYRAIARLDAVTGEELSQIKLPQRIGHIAYDRAQDPRRLVLSMANTEIRVYDVRTSELLFSERMMGGGIPVVGFAGDHTVLASGQALHAWDVPTGKLLWTGSTSLEVLPFLPDPLGERVLLPQGAKLFVLDALTGKQLTVMPPTPSAARRGAVHPGGRHLIAATPGGALQEWYIGEARNPYVLGHHLDDVGTLDVAPEGRFAASGGFGGIVRIWDLEASQLARSLIAHDSLLAAIRFSPDGRWLATADHGGEIRLWDGRTFEPVRAWRTELGGSTRVAFLPNSKRLVSYETPGQLALWSIPEGKLLAQREGVGDWGATRKGWPQLATSPVGNWIAHSEPDGIVSLHDADGLEPLHTLKAHTGVVTGLVFHPRERLLASASNDRSVTLIDPRNATVLRSYRPKELNEVYQAGLNSITWSPDGARLATGSYRGIITLWDAKDVEPVMTLTWPNWVNEIRFTPSGERLLAAISYGTVGISDTVPLREREPALERAARSRQTARPVVDAMLLDATPDEALAALDARADLDPETLEACRRLLHEIRATPVELVRRLWRDLLPRDQDRATLLLARGLGVGLWRRTNHQAKPNPEADTLLGLAFVRLGEHARALRVFERVAAMNEKRAPEMYAIDLCVAAMAHRGLDQPEESVGKLLLLEKLLADRPQLRTERVKALQAEAAGE